jgi:hypothetical protein
LQCEGKLPPMLLKHLAALCHRTLTSLNLSRDFTLTEEERMVPGMAAIKGFIYSFTFFLFFFIFLF